MIIQKITISIITATMIKRLNTSTKSWKELLIVKLCENDEQATPRQTVAKGFEARVARLHRLRRDRSQLRSTRVPHRRLCPLRSVAVATKITVVRECVIVNCTMMTQVRWKYNNNIYRVLFSPSNYELFGVACRCKRNKSSTQLYVYFFVLKKHLYQNENTVGSSGFCRNRSNFLSTSSNSERALCLSERGDNKPLLSFNWLESFSTFKIFFFFFFFFFF